MEFKIKNEEIRQLMNIDVVSFPKYVRLQSQKLFGKTEDVVKSDYISDIIISDSRNRK